MKLKIMEWNIKGAAALAWTKTYEINKDIVDYIVGKGIEEENRINADIIVLTEFVISKGWDYFQQQLEENRYIWFMTYETGNNGILICIKRSIVEEKNLVGEIYQGMAISSASDGCNILRVVLPLAGGGNLTVMGCRMETGGEKSFQKQYDFERKIFDDILMPMVESIGNMFVVCGDFNNARCLGKLSDKFDFKDYVGKAQCNYNLNIIKDSFDDLQFEMADIGREEQGISTHNGYIPDDHIFIRGLNIVECKAISACELSDHDIICATVELND